MNGKNIYEKVVANGQVHNQAAFRVALYRSDVRVATLPSNYNCVFRRPGFANGQIKAFHGRLLDLETPGAGFHVDVDQAVNEMNSNEGLRAFYRVGDEIRLAEPGILERIVVNLRRRGIMKTAESGISYLRNNVL